MIAQLADLLRVLVAKELKLRYRGTLLGVLWSLANPFAFALVLYVAFKRVFRVEIEDYPLFILAALFPWQWFSNSAGQGPNVFVSNAELIRKLRFPRSSLCVAVVATDAIHFAVTLAVFLALRWLFSQRGAPGLEWLVGLPLLFVAQFALALAAVLAFATWNAYLRDLEQLVRVALLLLFYLTPVLYPMTLVPEDLRWLVVGNPLGPLMVAWRELLLHDRLGGYAAIAAVQAAAAFSFALLVYRRGAARLAEVV